MHLVGVIPPVGTMHRKGKKHFMKLLAYSYDTNLTKQVDIFMKPNATTDEVMNAGEDFFLRLYGQYHTW